MNVEPDKKKARSTKDAPSNMPVGGIHFTPELLELRLHGLGSPATARSPAGVCVCWGWGGGGAAISGVSATRVYAMG